MPYNYTIRGKVLNLLSDTGAFSHSRVVTTISDAHSVQRLVDLLQINWKGCGRKRPLL